MNHFSLSRLLKERLALFAGLLFLGLFFQFASATVSHAQGSSEDYRRWKTYSRRTSGLVFQQSFKPHWLPNQRDEKLWFQTKTGSDTHEFWLVNPSDKQRQPAFDHQALAQALSDKTQHDLRADQIKIRSLDFSDDLSSIKFKFGGQNWQFDRPSGPLRKTVKSSDPSNLHDRVEPRRSVSKSSGSQQDSSIDFRNQTSQALKLFWVSQAGKRIPYGKLLPGKSMRQSSFVGHAWVLSNDAGQDVAAFQAEATNEVAIVEKSTPKPTSRPIGWKGRRRNFTSPNGKWTLRFNEGRPLIVSTAPRDKPSQSTPQINFDTDSNERFGNTVWWSPDSNYFVLMEIKDAKKRQITMVDSAPDNSIHGKLKTITYVKPGDELDISRPVLFDIGAGKAITIDDKLFDNPFSITDVQWNPNSKSFSFLYNQRGHQTLRLISVDAKTGVPNATIDEQSATFICYSQKKFLKRLDKTNEAIWMSERSGWNHLYLIDQQSGKVKNAITSGNWVVRKVDRVDEQNRQIHLAVSGIDADQDPYHVHLVRVGFDGKNLTRLTRDDGNHRWEFSPGNRYLIDTFSRVDLPQVTQLRDAKSGDLVCELQRGDASKLLATGWRYPQRFVAKGRDGKTDIHGVIVRPTNFDPKKRYPVLEDIYAGPHSAFAPKDFGLHNRMYEMAELGFIVVKMDGMGTNHRSKAFHDRCWKNLGDSGFPDRIAWIKAAAKENPEMDLDRVGIWGGSAGGQSAMRSLIAHGDFYKAAAADCGCHDNRVDKIWWNEQWMGWPIGPHYAQQSNVTQAHRLQGDLMLIWGELDTNVDPVSTVQVIDELIKADKDFEQLIMPGVGHGAAGHPYAKRRQADFFVRKLHGVEPRHDSETTN